MVRGGLRSATGTNDVKHGGQALPETQSLGLCRNRASSSHDGWHVAPWTSLTPSSLGLAKLRLAGLESWEDDVAKRDGFEYAPEELQMVIIQLIPLGARGE